jgi:hypothetical protein
MTSKDYELESEFLLKYGLDIQSIAKHISKSNTKKLADEVIEELEMNALTFKRERDSVLLWQTMLGSELEEQVIEDLELHILSEVVYYHGKSSIVFDRTKKEAHLILENGLVICLPSMNIIE